MRPPARSTSRRRSLRAWRPSLLSSWDASTRVHCVVAKWDGSSFRRCFASMCGQYVVWAEPLFILRFQNASRYGTADFPDASLKFLNRSLFNQ
jgi:hypothetical protein